MKRTLQSIRALLLATGIAAIAAQPASAVTEERFFLLWADWETFTALGSDVVVGQIDGGLPNLDHVAFDGATIIPIVFPLPVISSNDPVLDGDPKINRQFFFTSHATATLGAIGARNPALGDSPLGGIQGFAPESTLIVAGLGDGVNPITGNIAGVTNEAILFSLLMMTDQAFADAAIGDLNAFWQDYIFRHTNPFTGEIPLDDPARDLHPSFLNQPPYRVATVVNIPFTNAENRSARAGGDTLSQIINILTVMTPATFVASAGNEGDRQDLEDNDPPEGSVGSPATAFNVISVGFTESGINGQIDEESSKGPSPRRDRRVDGLLLLDVEGTLMPPPTLDVVPDIASGVDIVAPGFELELPGSFIGDPLSNTAFIKGWTGSSMSSSIVTGAIAQLHDLHRKRFLLLNPNDPLGQFNPNAVLPSLVTKAILFSSATKTQGFRSGATPAPDERNALVTNTPLDPEVGAGRLHMRRLLNQYLGSPSIGGYQDLVSVGGAEVKALRRDQTITDPDSVTFLSPNEYVSLNADGTPRLFRGTDPSVASITFFQPPGQGGRGGGLRNAQDPAEPLRFDSDDDANVTMIYPAQLIPPGELDGSFGGTGDGSGLNSPSNSNGLTLGEQEVQGGTTTGNIGSPLDSVNPNNTLGQLFLAGWDHGMVGVGVLDLPIGLITEGSTVSVALVWNETQVFDQRLIDLFRDAVEPANLRTVSREMTSSLVHQATAAGVPIPQEGSPEAEALLAPPPTRRESVLQISDDLDYFEPTVMAGFNVDTTNPPIGFDPADNDNPNDFFDYATNTGHLDALADGTLNPQSSAFRGVCHIKATTSSGPLFFTGVAISPRHILTAAHNFDPNNSPDSFPDNFKAVDITFHGIGSDGGTVRYGPGDLEKPVQPHTNYGGIGPIQGFSDDLAIITLDLIEGVDDFTARGIPFYSIAKPTLPGPDGPPLDIIIVGYGESGFGDIGVDPSQFPNTGSVRRIGFNQLLDNFIRGNSRIAVEQFLLQTYLFDFDGPPLIFGEGLLEDGFTIGNQMETIHTLGDSGGPAFQWLDSGDGMGGPADGQIQQAELRLFGLNTARLSGSSATIDTFGAIGVGVILSSYDTTGQDNFINDTINEVTEPVPPGSGPFLTFITSTDGLLDFVLEWEFENLDLELYRIDLDGAGFQIVGASRAIGYSAELIFIQNNDDLIKLGNYFARIVYNDTIWDFGGFLFEEAESTPQQRTPPVRNAGALYNNLFPADVEYGFAFYVDLIRDPNIFGFRSTTTRSIDGSSSITQEPYHILTFEDLIGDMNADADIDGTDLITLLGLWGKTGTPGQTRGDLNANGIVDSSDLAILLKNYTGPGIN